MGLEMVELSSLSMPTRRNPTQEELTAAFALVKNKEHWKNPINTTLEKCDEETQRLIEDAIIHFTGSVAEVTRYKNGKVKFCAVGYFIAVGA